MHERAECSHVGRSAPGGHWRNLSCILWNLWFGPWFCCFWLYTRCLKQLRACVCVFYVSMFKNAFKSMPILKHEVPRWLSPSRPMAHGKIVGCFSNFWQMTQARTCCLAAINVPNTSSTRMVWFRVQLHFTPCFFECPPMPDKTLNATNIGPSQPLSTKPGNCNSGKHVVQVFSCF